MKTENVPENFELYKLLDLLKKNDHILPEVIYQLCAKIYPIEDNALHSIKENMGLE